MNIYKRIYFFNPILNFVSDFFIWVVFLFTLNDFLTPAVKRDALWLLNIGSLKMPNWVGDWCKI